MDENNNVVVDFLYDEIGEGLFDGVPIIPVKQDDKYGFINSSGQLVTPIIYDEVDLFSAEMSMVRKQNKVGFIDTTGKVVVTIIYDDAQRFSSDLTPVKTGKKWGYINKSGKLVLPAIYDGAYWFIGNYASVTIGKEEFYINKQGKKDLAKTKAMEEESKQFRKEMEQKEEKNKYIATTFCFSNSTQSQRVIIFDKSYHDQFETGLEGQPATIIIKTASGTEKTIRGTWIIKNEGFYGQADYLTITFTGANSHLGNLKFLVLRDDNRNTQTLKEITRNLNYEKCN